MAQSARPPPTIATQRAPTANHCYTMRGDSHADNVSFPETGRTVIGSTPLALRRWRCDGGAAAVALRRGGGIAARGCAARSGSRHRPGAALASLCEAATAASRRGTPAEGLGHGGCARRARARRDAAERARARTMYTSHAMTDRARD